MIPRLHRRGQSFKGACRYILHDAGRTTADRVGWTMTCNLASDPEWAWHEMYETWANQADLKAASGQDARGRKNLRPVLHYTLSWAASEKPSPEHMQQTALASLKALGLQDHEALIAAHSDKQHMHVHIVVNTVHPQTGLTAPMKFTKLELSRWAESYEREHGIHCDERIKNNEERRRHADARSRDAGQVLSAASERRPAKARPYVPVKHRATGRDHWFDRKEIIERLKSMRAPMEAELKAARGATWDRQQAERDELDSRSEAAVDHARAHMKERYRRRWRDLYRAQKKEERRATSLRGNLLERAAFVYARREHLGAAGAPLTLRQMMPLIRSENKLTRRLQQVHEKERRTLARHQKLETKILTDTIWSNHRFLFAALRDRQAAERAAEKEQQAAKRNSVSFAHAKAALANEYDVQPLPQRSIKRDAGPVPAQEAFAKAAGPSERQISRVAKIRRDMEEWRKRNPDRDPGREL